MKTFSSVSEGEGSSGKKASAEPKMKPPLKAEMKPPVEEPPINPDGTVKHRIPSNMSAEQYRSFFFKKRRTKNVMTGGLLMAAVFGIYFYSMYAVNQDPLDDILEEAKPNTQ